MPTGLPTFGAAGSNTIQVVVFGDVNRPGYYYLREGAVVRDAVEAAQGLLEISSYSRVSHSSIARQTADGSYELIWFTRGRELEGQIRLNAGDQLRFDHERY